MSLGIEEKSRTDIVKPEDTNATFIDLREMDAVIINEKEQAKLITIGNYNLDFSETTISHMADIEKRRNWYAIHDEIYPEDRSQNKSVLTLYIKGLENITRENLKKAIFVYLVEFPQVGTIDLINRFRREKSEIEIFLTELIEENKIKLREGNISDLEKAQIEAMKSIWDNDDDEIWNNW